MISSSKINICEQNLAKECILTYKIHLHKEVEKSLEISDLSRFLESSGPIPDRDTHMLQGYKVL